MEREIDTNDETESLIGEEGSLHTSQGIKLTSQESNCDLLV